jgi:hypothetical protein
MSRRYTQGMVVLIKPMQLRFFAAAKNLGVKDLAEGVGVTPEHFGKVLARGHELRPKARRALLRLLRVSFDEVFEIVPDTPRSEAVHA